MRWLTMVFAQTAFLTAMPMATLAGRAPLVQDPALAEVFFTAEDLLRSPVRSEAGDVAAEIEEIIIDPGGSVRLVIVELVEPERKTVAIPWSYLTVREDGSIWLSASESDLLRAPSFSPEDSNAPSSGPVPAPLSGALTTYVPALTPTAGFQPGNVQSYRGVVVGTMTAPLAGRTDEVVAIIDVGDEEVEARIGPQSFLDRIGLLVEPGEKVVFEGSPSDVEGTTVVTISKISVGERSFLLRDRDGTPRWR